MLTAALPMTSLSIGCDYDSKAFYCRTDRSGTGNKNMGSRLWALDTAAAAPRWTELPPLPSQPRWVMSFTAVGGALYMIGGAVIQPGESSSSLIDCWKFTPGSASASASARGRARVSARASAGPSGGGGGVWSRLADMPFSSSNWQTNGAHAFMDRYIILAGGYQYGQTMSVNGTVTKGAMGGTAHQLCPEGSKSQPNCWPCAAAVGGDEYYNDVLVYDVVGAAWGVVNSTSHSDPELIPAGCQGKSLYPMNDNLPQVNVITDDAKAGKGRVFTAGGECDTRTIGAEVYQHYPALALLGDITIN